MATPPSYAELRQSMPSPSGECCLFAGRLRATISSPDAVLNIEPDYQRGHVWTDAQSAAFVGHRLEGGDCSTLTIQRWADATLPDELVDGRQRLLATLGFVEGRIPALLSDGRSYFISEWSAADRAILPNSFDLMLRARYVTCPTRAAVLRLYLRLNRGGSVHTDSEIDRVRGLLAAAEMETP